MGDRARALKLFERAYQCQLAGDLAGAIQLYQASIAVQPTAEAHTFLGWVYSFERRYEAAIAECKRAIQADPTFGNPYNDIGCYLMELGVAMADLRDLVARLGFGDARSLLQSGGLETDFFVRSAREWEAIIARNPFRKDAERDPGHLVVMLLKQAPDAEDVKALQAAITGAEVVRAAGKHLYIVYPDGIGRSRLTSALIEKKLGTRGTGRNWNTVLKLRSLADS